MRTSQMLVKKLKILFLFFLALFDGGVDVDVDADAN